MSSDLQADSNGSDWCPSVLLLPPPLVHSWTLTRVCLTCPWKPRTSAMYAAVQAAVHAHHHQTCSLLGRDQLSLVSVGSNRDTFFVSPLSSLEVTNLCCCCWMMDADDPPRCSQPRVSSAAAGLRTTWPASPGYCCRAFCILVTVAVVSAALSPEPQEGCWPRWSSR